MNGPFWRDELDLRSTAVPAPPFIRHRAAVGRISDRGGGEGCVQRAAPKH